MIEILISLIVSLLIAGVIYWAATTILGLLPLPAIIKSVIQVLIILVVCLIVIYALVPLLHAPLWR